MAAHGPFGRLAALLARRPVLPVAACAILAAVGAALAQRVEADPGAEALFLRDDPALAALDEFNRVFSGDEVVVLALKGPVLTEEGLARLERLTEAAAAVAGVTSATSLANVKNIYQGPVEIFAWPPYERFKDGDITFAEFRAEVLGEPLFAGNLISRDGALAAIVCELGAREATTVAALRQVASEAAGGGFETFAAGHPMERYDLTAYIARDQRIFVPLVVLVLAAMTLLLFRQVWGVLLPLAVVGVSVAVTMGTAGALGKSLNALTSMVTPVVMVVAVAASVNMCTAYAQARAEMPEGAPRAAGVAAGLDRIGAPCLFTTLTTAFGFGSLALSDVPAISDFGALCALGVCVSYVAALALLPPLLAREWPRGPGSLHLRPGRIEHVLAHAAPFLERWRWGFLAGAAALLAAGVVGISRIRVETDIIAQLPPTSDLARATREIDRSLAGVNTLEVLFRGPKGAFRTLEGLRAVADVQAALARMEGVAKTISIVDFLGRIGEVKKRGRALAADQETLDYQLGLLDRAGEARGGGRSPPAREGSAPVHAFLSADGSRARLTARLVAMTSSRSFAVIEAVRALARERLPPGIEAEPTGSFVLLQDMTAALPYAQAEGLAIATALILGSMTLLFRSLRLGALAALPVSIPIVFVYGFMGWTGIELSIATSMISSVVLGLGVDSTILFLSRYRDERLAGASRREAIERMLERAGQSVSYSNLTLVFGFAVAVLSSFPPVRYFGLLTAGTIGVSYVGALVILPSLVFAFGAGVAASAGAAAKGGGAGDAEEPRNGRLDRTPPGG